MVTACTLNKTEDPMVNDVDLGPTQILKFLVFFQALRQHQIG